MIIKEYLPSIFLQSCIKSFIIIEDNDGLICNKIMSIYPSGYLEMIISYGDTTYFLTENGFVLKNAASYLGGQILKPTYYKCIGKFKILSIIFRPYGIYRLLGIPQYELTEYKIDLDLIFGNEGNVLIDKLCEEQDYNEKIKIVEEYFYKLFIKNSVDFPRIISAVNIIEQSLGRENVKVLSNRLNINIKTLERNFKQAVGISPKEFSRIIRFNKVFNAINSKNNIDIFDVIYKYGYYDQSHFINEFKQFTGQNPSKFIKKEKQDIEYSFRERVKI